MQMPRVMRGVNRALTNPLISIFAGVVPPFAMVHHVGRETGSRYRTPVVAFPTGRGYVIPLPYGTDTDWCLNVLRAGHCSLHAAGQYVALGNPRIAKAATALTLFPPLLRPGLQLANLPGYLLLDRNKSTKKRHKR